MTSHAKVLILGAGGREHALALRLLESASVREVVVSSGNPGTASAPARFEGKILRNAAGSPLEVTREERPDLVVVGPEEHLKTAIAEAIEKLLGIPVFGPSNRAARLELSKSWAKDFMGRHGILTARHVTVRSVEELKAALDVIEAPVIKADGHTSGKWVYLTDNREHARRTALEMFNGRATGFGEQILVLEERVAGLELSVHAICDGERFIVLPHGQEQKRVGAGDTGAHTGGMGAYAPAPLVDGAKQSWIAENIIGKAIQGLAEEGVPFRGALHARVMVPPTGDPVVIGYNACFGDPQAQALLNVIDGDLGQVLGSAAQGALAVTALTPAPRSALCVVVASRGYPGVPHTGELIRGVEKAEALAGVRVYHAGTLIKGGTLLSATGRVLGITGIGATLAEATERAYAGVKEISFTGMQFRGDLAAQGLGERSPS